VAASVTGYSVALLQSATRAVPSRTDFAEPVDDRQRVAGFGVFVSGTHILTHTAALDGRSVVEVWPGTTAAAPARVVAYEPPTGLTLLEVATAVPRTSATFANEPPRPGALAVAVGRSEERDLAVPVFVTGAGRGRFTIGAVNEILLPGMPVFTLAGDLFAITAPDGDEVQAVPVRDAAERMLARAAAGERRSSFGIGFQPANDRLAALFGGDGVLVTEVVPGSPADVADVRIGDVLLAIGTIVIDSADAAAGALNTATPGGETTLRLRRAGRTLDLAATPVFAYEIAALARGQADTAAAPEARALFPAALLDASAIPPSARVIAVNGRPGVTRAQVQRELRLARQPIPVLLRVGRAQFFVAVDPVR
jgi:S1-C subfamily serine protease